LIDRNLNAEVPEMPGRPRVGISRGRSSRHWSVRTYLIVIVVAAVVAVAAASVAGFVWSGGQARDEATRDMTLQARRAASSIASSIDAGKRTVAGLAAQPGLSAVFAKPVACNLSAEGSGAFPSVRLDIVAPDGRVACSSDASRVVSSGGVHRGSAWLRDALGAPAVSVHWSTTDAALHKAAVAVTAPVANAGRTVGTVVLFMHVPQSAEALAHDVAGFEDGSFTLVDRAAHTVVSASEAQREGRGQIRFADSKRAGDWIGVDGSRRIFGSADVRGSDWRVYAGVRRSAVLADARGVLARHLAVGLLALLILAAAVWILNRRIAGPLRAVTDAMVRAGRDAGGTRVAEAGSAELVALAREFNSMLDVRAGHDAQLVHLATHDPLTGLPNRTLLHEQLDKALHRDRDRGNIAVLFIGLNRLHIVNDGFGHDAADRLLGDVSARLMAALRPCDTLARFDSAEFVVLCEEGQGDHAGELAERLQQCLDQPFRGPSSDIVLHASIGIADASELATSADQLLREAHTAMREAMSTGRGWCRFNDELQVRATEHLALEHALWQALERDEFVVHYQPLLDVGSGRIVGTEALVRWQHPERGLVAPMEFIPIAEATGQIIAIGRFVLREACKQAAAWAAAGRPLRMSVNVAVDELSQDNFPDAVREVLSETGLAPDTLCLEITESSLMRATAPSSSALAGLKQLGVKLAIDDFGTGYSSLSYLHEFPVDELKIDRSFIGRLDRDTRDKHLVGAIIGMAHALGLTVVAEGVETDQQLQLLGELGCQLAQGYLFATAQPADRLLALVEGQRPDRPLALAR
jgi:diguanylate cyclase (GGDEF)-like protein